MSGASLISLAVAFALFAAALLAPALVRLNLLLYERIGARSLRRFWGQQVSWWVPMVRTTSAVLGALFLLRALGVI